MVQTEERLVRDAHMELLRIAACFFVVMIHIPRDFSFSGVFYHAVSRFCIPSFCMISGYYMLDRDICFYKILQKCGRLFSLMIIWSGIYYAQALCSGALAWAGMGDAVAYLLTQPAHLWYFYTVIGLYLFTPLFAVFCKHAGRREFCLGLGLTFLFGSIVVIAIRSGCVPVLAVVIEKMKIDPTLGFVFCYLFGGYVRKFELSSGARVGIFLGGTVGILLPVVLFLCQGKDSQTTIELLLSFFAPNALAVGMAAFVLAIRLGEKGSGVLRRFQKPICRMSSYTMGVCFIHLLGIEWVDPVMRRLLSQCPLCIAVPVRAFHVFLLSVGGTCLLGHIPVVRKLVL